MDEDDVVTDAWLAGEFEASRPRLEAVAYQMLGSRADAEDVVQETWIRLHRSDAAEIDNLAGWLTTVVSRACLDRLRTRRARREHPAAEPPRDRLDPDTDVHDPAHQALVAESVGAALLVVLERLTPAERVAFVLHDVFAVPFDEVAPIVGRSPAATRQLASRARRRVRETPSTAELDLVARRDVVEAFLRAAQGGDFDTLLQLLDPDVVLRPDAAAVGMGSLPETHGAEAVASALAGGAQGAQRAIVEGVAALVWAPGGRTRGVIEFTVRDGRVVAIDVTGDAERIAALDVVVLDD